VPQAMAVMSLHLAENTVKNLKDLITEELIHNKNNQTIYQSLRKKQPK